MQAPNLLPLLRRGGRGAGGRWCEALEVVNLVLVPLGVWSIGVYKLVRCFCAKSYLCQKIINKIGLIKI